MNQDLVIVFAARGFRNELTAVRCESPAQHEDFTARINGNSSAWVADAELKRDYLNDFFGDYSNLPTALPAIINNPD